MWDEDKDIESVVTFSYCTYDSDGNQTANIERSLYNHEAESLNDVLQAFYYFLIGMTFTYVDGVAAYDKAKNDVASSG